ncbi:hypothetical protein [Paraburkholderia sp. SIMBA_054]|uniref:hypothetical protein n=1 Tax=Paraburkholderia sp. SIMBA_054 TaxID=3085795 RepID=UPI003979C1D0
MKAKDADAGGFNVLSIGEKLAVALVLDRPDWIRQLNFTLAEALDRVGPEWARLIPAAAQQFHAQKDDDANAAASEARQAQLAGMTSQTSNGPLDFSATLVSCGEAPGYRDVYLTLDLRSTDGDHVPPIRACIRIRAEDGGTVATHIAATHRAAWDRNGRPLDASEAERRPAWLDRL